MTGNIFMITRILRIRFIEATMTAKQHAAYAELSKQMQYTDLSDQKIKVPASLAEKDAKKALKRLKLECDPRQDFVVTWESRNGAWIRMTENPNKPTDGLKPGEKPTTPRPPEA